MKRRIVVGVAAAMVVLSACSSTVLELDVGTCFDDPENIEEVRAVPVVDCSESHDNEVIANRDIFGNGYPGQDEVEDLASEVCYDSFAAYVGIAYEKSIYEIGSLFPTEGTWAFGDREVICFAYDIELQKISGSINGVGR
jgi:hypothetical protein